MKLLSIKLLMLAMIVMPMIVVPMVRAEEDDDEDESKKTTSPDADTVILFTKPPGTSNLELPAGQIAEFLVGFTNKGDQEMVVDSMEASLRYPMDFTFHLQNFSAINYVKAVKSKQQA